MADFCDTFCDILSSASNTYVHKDIVPQKKLYNKQRKIEIHGV